MVEFLQNLKVNVKEQEVFRLIGYGRNDPAPAERVRNTLVDAIKEGYSLIEPKAIYTWVEVKKTEGTSLVLNKGIRLEIGNSIKFWEGAQYFAIALCTIGPSLEERVRERFTQGEFPLALMLDSVGSVAVESIADQANYSICQKAHTIGLRAGRRLSPGYGKWAIHEQEVLFALLSGELIGVQLNEGCIMIPKKSISFGAAVGKRVMATINASPCRYCNLPDCQYRRLLHSEEVGHVNNWREDQYKH